MRIISDSPKVTIICLAYNHGQYIHRTLEGFVMQQTDFKFEAFVHDDASTDNTAEIIREFVNKYPNIIKPLYEKENQYSKLDETIYKIIEENSRGQYVAFCEGDDYWVDPFKLQKQVENLDRFPEVTCVHTGFYTIDKDGERIIRPIYDKYMRKSHSGNVLRTIINGNYVMTLTTMYRKEVLMSSIYKNCHPKYDYALTFAAAMMGDFIYLPEKTGCYRKTPGGAMDQMHSDINNPLRKAGIDIYAYFARLIILKKDMPIFDKIVLRFHIIVYLSRTSLKKKLKEVIRDDALSMFLLPLALCYKRIKY